MTVKDVRKICVSTIDTTDVGDLKNTDTRVGSSETEKTTGGQQPFPCDGTNHKHFTPRTSFRRHPNNVPYSSTLNFPWLSIVMVDFHLRPGILSVISFLFLEVAVLGAADIAITRILASYYINRVVKRGARVELRNTDTLGLTRHVIGDRLAFGNILTVVFKLLIFVTIFLINLSLSSRTVILETGKIRMGTFYLNPSDDAWNRDVVYTISRAHDDSRACYERDGDMITYYRIAFNLTGGVLLEDDLGDPDVNETSQYQINRSSIVCLSPTNSARPLQLAKVIGCSRNREDCLEKKEIAKNITDVGNVTSSSGIRRGGFLFNYTNFEDRIVEMYFPEYPIDRVNFTCMSVWVGHDENARASRKCLLVYRTGERTLIEKWSIFPHEAGGLYFSMIEAGPIFLGDVPIERRQSGDYLSRFDFISENDYTKLASDLVSLSGDFNGNTLVTFKETDTVSSLPVVSLVGAGILVAFVIVVTIIALVISVRNKSPRINTIAGLSSLMRAQFHQPERNQSFLKDIDSQVGIMFSDNSNETCIVRRADVL